MPLSKKINEKIAFEKAILRLYQANARNRLKPEAGPRMRRGRPDSLALLDAIILHKRSELAFLYDAQNARGGIATDWHESPELRTIAELGFVSLFLDPAAGQSHVIQAIRIIELAGRTIALNLLEIAEESGEVDFVIGFRRIQKEGEQILASLRLSREKRVLGRLPSVRRP